MAVSLLHLFHSAQPDDPDATLIRPSNWNAQHALTGTPGAILGFDGSGNAIEVSGSGVPGAPNHSVQFNLSSAFAGNANFLFTGSGTPPGPAGTNFGFGLTNNFPTALGNDVTLGQYTLWKNSASPGYTHNFPGPYELIIQQHYTGDLGTWSTGLGYVQPFVSVSECTYTGGTGIGAIHQGGAFHAIVNPESTGPFNGSTGLFVDADYAGAGLCDWIYGLQGTAVFSPTTARSDATGVIGAYLLGTSQNVCSNVSLYGAWLECHLTGASGSSLPPVLPSTALSMIGSTVQHTFDIGTSTPLAIGYLADVPLTNTGVTITDLIGLQLNDYSGIGTTHSYNLWSKGATALNVIDGIIQFNGSTSGNVKVQAPATVTTPWTFKLPPTPGTIDYVLRTDGSGVTTWVPQTGGGAVSSVTGTGAITVSPTTGATVVSVATATTSVLGVVKPDGTSITISGGVITAHASGGTGTPGGTLNSVQYNNPLGSFAGAAHTNIDASGQINVDNGFAYMYNSLPAIYAVPNVSGDNWFEGEAGNFTLTGFGNFGTGTLSLSSLTTGTNNLAVGAASGASLTSGVGNVAIGAGALRLVTADSFNTVIGNAAMGNATGGGQNTALGQQALQNNTTGVGNFAMGFHALINNTTGSSSIAIGQSALAASVTDGGNIAIGPSALQFVNGSTFNTGVGYEVLDAATTGAQNTAFGAFTLHAVQTGQFNVAIGSQALVVTTGSNSTAIGLLAGGNATSGSANTFLGFETGLGITTGSNNLIIGDHVDTGSNVSGCIVIGCNATNHLDYNLTTASTWTTHSDLAVPNGKVVVGPSTTSYPAMNFGSGVAPTSPADGDYWYDGTNLNFRHGGTTTNLLAGGGGAVSSVTGTGGITVSPTTGAVIVSLSTPITVANGGSGAATFTAHGLLLGNAASAFGVTGVGTTNQVLTGVSGADPVWSTTVNGAAMPAYTGDVTSAIGGTVNTLASIITAGGPTGSATTVPVITWDAKGRLTAVTTAAISIAAGSVSGLAPIATSGSATDLTTGTLPSARFGPLTGDVTTSGYAATLANIPTGTPAVGTILHTNIAAPSAPAAGKIAVYTNTTNNILSAMNSAGTVSNTVVPDTGATNNFLTAISAGGVISKAQPSFANLSGSIASTQMPAYTGDVTSSAGATVNTLINIPTGTTAAGAILHTNIAAPSNPAAGKIQVYTDTTNNILSAKNSGGTVSNTVVPATAGANQFATAISAAGVISFAQPTVANLSGLPVTVAQGGTGLATLPVHTLLIGNATSNVANTGTGTANQILISNGASVDPSWTTTLPTAATPAYTGDVTSSAGATVNTLASVITAGGPTGNATTVPVITYDAKGRLTAVTTATIAAGTANVDPSPQRVVATTGGSTTMTGWNLVLDPAGALATYTVVLPASPTNGQIAAIRSSQPISTLNFTTTPATAVAAPNTLAAGSRLEAIYISATTSWYFAL